MSHSQLNDWVHAHARKFPASNAFATWRSSAEASAVTFATVAKRMGRVARGLRRMGVTTGDRVMLSLPNDDSFPVALLGILEAGAIAVPAPVPTISRTRAFQERLAAIARSCQPELMIGPEDWHDKLASATNGLRVVSLEETLDAGAEFCERADRTSAQDIAFVQYTSGSTASPRGVTVTHAMLEATCRQAVSTYHENATDIAATWVPLYHDMGLITAVARPLFSGYLSVLLRPEDFVKSPISWLEAISHYGATLSSAPNFAYDLCVRKCDARSELNLDLSVWRIARNAGEVIRLDTIQRFSRRFASAGFRPSAMSPSYGMAEATLLITTCGPDDPFIEAPVPDGDGTVVSSGIPAPDTDVAIDSPGGSGSGEILVRGPQVFPGYWQHPERRGWFRTGDFGFLRSGHLFVLGRVDDTLVVHGKKIFASDVAAACRRVDGVRPGRIAAFTISSTSGERVCIVGEVATGMDTGPASLRRLALLLALRVAQSTDLVPTEVHFVPHGGLPVTTSGKVRAKETRRQYLLGTLPIIGGR